MTAKEYADQLIAAGKTEAEFTSLMAQYNPTEDQDNESAQPSLIEEMQVDESFDGVNTSEIMDLEGDDKKKKKKEERKETYYDDQGVFHLALPSADKKSNKEVDITTTNILESFDTPIGTVEVEPRFYKIDEDGDLVTTTGYGYDEESELPLEQGGQVKEDFLTVDKDVQKINKTLFGKAIISRPAEGSLARERYDRKLKNKDIVEEFGGLLSNVVSEEQKAIYDGDLTLQRIHKVDKKHTTPRNRGRLTSNKYIPGAIAQPDGTYKLDTDVDIVDGDYYVNEYINKKGETVYGTGYAIVGEYETADGEKVENPIKAALEGKEVKRSFVVDEYKDVSTNPLNAAKEVFLNISKIEELEKQYEELMTPEEGETEPFFGNVEAAGEILREIKILEAKQVDLLSKAEKSKGLDDVINTLSTDRTLDNDNAIVEFSNSLSSALSGNAVVFNRKDGGEISKDLNNKLRGYNIVFQPMNDGLNILGQQITTDLTNVAYFINPVVYSTKSSVASGETTYDKVGLVDVEATFKLNLGNKVVPDYVWDTFSEEERSKIRKAFGKDEDTIKWGQTYKELSNRKSKYPNLHGLTYNDIDGEYGSLFSFTQGTGSREEWYFNSLKQAGLAGQYDNDGDSLLKKALTGGTSSQHYIPEWMEEDKSKLDEKRIAFKKEIMDNYEKAYGATRNSNEDIVKNNAPYFRYDNNKFPKRVNEDGKEVVAPFFNPLRTNTLSIYSNHNQFNAIKTYTKDIVEGINEASKSYKKVAPQISRLVNEINNRNDNIKSNIDNFNDNYNSISSSITDLKVQMKDNATKFEQTYLKYKDDIAEFENKVFSLQKEYQEKVDDEVNPVRQEELIKEFNLKQEELRQQFKPIEENYNEIAGGLQDTDEYLIEEHNFLVKELNSLVKDTNNKEYDIEERNERDKLIKKLQKLQPKMVNALNQLTFYDDYYKSLDGRINKIFEMDKKVQELGKGQGSAWGVIKDRFTETMFKAAGGVSMFMGDISNAMVDARREFYKSLPGMLPSTFPVDALPEWTDRDESIYRADKAQINSNQKMIAAETNSLIDFYKTLGYNDQYAQAFAETTVGGVSLQIADMVGRGGPLGGLFMFTQTRLDKYNEYEQSVKDAKLELTQKYVDEGMTPSKAARKADKEVDSKFTVGERRTAALTQATVQGLLEQLSLSILGGTVKLGAKPTKAVTNYVLSRLPKGKMHIKVLQRKVNELVGSRLAGWIALSGQQVNKGLGEVIVEELQEYANWGIDDYIQSTSGVDLDLTDPGSEEWKKNISQTRKVAFATGILFGVGGMAANGKAINKAFTENEVKKNELRAILEQHYNLFRNDEYVDLMKAKVNIAYEQGVIESVDERNKMIENINQQQEVQSSLPENMDGIAAAEASQIVEKINELKVEKEKESSNKKQINKQINSLEAELDVLYSSSTSYKGTGSLDANVETNIEIASMLADMTGTDYDVAENLDEYIAKSANAGVDLIYFDENGKVIDKSDTDAFYVKDKESGKIVINKQKMKQIGSFSAATHEVLHAITALQLKEMSQQERDQLVRDFSKELNFDEFAAVKARLNQNYGVSPEQATSEEWFNAFHDAVVKKDISYDKKLFSGIKNFVVDNILAPTGLVNKEADFKSAKGVYNFIKDYSIQTSKMLEGDQEIGKFEGEVAKVMANIKPGDVGTGTQFSNTQATKFAKEFKEGTIQPDNIEDFIKQYHNIGLKAMKFDMSKGSIESDEAISFLNREFPSIMKNYDPSKGLEFSTYVNNVIPKRAVAFYEEQVGDKAATTSLDSDQARQMEADDSSPTDNRTDKEIRKEELTKIKVKDRVKPVYKENVKELSNMIKSVASQLDLNKVNYKTLKGLFPTETAVAIARNKELGESIAKKIKENKDLSKSEMLAVQKFVKANASLAQAMLPEGYTSEFKSTGVQNKLLENFYNKRSVRSKTGAGLAVQIKKPSMADSKFLQPFGIEGNDFNKWNQDRLKHSQLLKAMVMQFDQIITNQSVREQLLEEGKPAEALQTLADGKSVVLFSSTENLGKSWRKLGQGKNGLQDQAVYLSGLNEFISRINAGQSVDTAFQNTYKGFLNKKDDTPLAIRKEITNEWKKVYDGFNPDQADYETGTPSPQELEEYLHTAFAEQTEKETVQTLLGIDNSGLDKNNREQIMKYYSFYNEYFGELMQKFNGDEKLFVEYVVNRIMPTLTSAAKVMNGKYRWDGDVLVETEKGAGSDRSGLFNNKQEFMDLLIKPFLNEDTEIIYTPRKGFTLNGEQIVENRAKQSKAASEQALKEYTENGKISDETLDLSAEYAKNNQEAIVDILKWAKNKEADSKSQISINDIGMFFIGSTGNMESILRAAYALDSIAVDPKDLKAGNYRYEHNPPVRVMQTYMAQFMNGDITEQQLRDKFEDTSASVIPEQMDEVINVRYKDTIPLAYVNRWSRYLNSYTYGKYPFDIKVYNKVDGKWEVSTKGAYMPKAYDAARPALLESSTEIKDSKVVSYSNTELTIEEVLSKAATLDEALQKANALNKPVKKIRVFDFDDTLATTKSNVLYTTPDGKKGKLNAEEFAKQGKALLDEGYKFDFSEFNKVTKGQPGPLLDIAKKIQDARGTEDVFVLTARAPESQVAIKEFLDSQGLNIPLKNITGLGNSTGAAKANWIVDKAAEGYNDFYFADDALQNVKAVKDALSVIDIKSKVQQAKVQFSETLSEDFNRLLEESTGVDYFKEYSAAKAKTVGASKGKFKFFIPYSAEDYVGLVYPTLAKGKKGDAQMAWYKQNVLDPYGKAMESLSADRIQLMSDFRELKKNLNVPAKLRKKNESGFTNEQAVRVYLFDKMGHNIPGISDRDLKELKSIVENDEELNIFANEILTVTKGDGYAKPNQNWLIGTITTDLIELLNTEKRSKYLKDWNENIDAIYSKENLNKLEALYGAKYREALENMLSRMKSGKNRTSTGSRLENKILDYINGSVGAIMFFNTRSAVLQTISAINFINWDFNNPLKASQAFANQPQYWKDFVTLMNSKYLTDRRNGLKLNISESEIADAAATSKNKAKAVLNYILEKGYIPTKYADSFAIASGGATFYRNKIKDLMKKNPEMTEAEASEIAMSEWKQISEISQQSSDPSKISQQQAGGMGRLLLAFANTPMQYARIQKRAFQDLVNGRGDMKSNISKIIYYGFVQNIIFNALQQAVFAMGFGDDEDDEANEKKYFNTVNGMLDSTLRGIGIAGQSVSVIKNFLLNIYERCCVAL